MKVKIFTKVLKSRKLESNLLKKYLLLSRGYETFTFSIHQNLCHNSSCVTSRLVGPRCLLQHEHLEMVQDGEFKRTDWNLQFDPEISDWILARTQLTPQESWHLWINLSELQTDSNNLFCGVQFMSSALCSL